jgi:ubiquinone/menaquinone biosynthesis C-methylase UbiE
MLNLKYNKPFEITDMEEIERSSVAKELKELIGELKKKNLATTITGNLKNTNLNSGKEFFTDRYLWSYVKIIEGLNLNPGQKVLDGGGASSPIVFYYGKAGMETHTLDLQESLVENTKKVAEEMNWDIRAERTDMTKTNFPDNYFDAIFSIAVLQVLPNEIKMKAMKEFARILKPEGTIGLIFDLGESTKKKANYQYHNYDQLHTPIRNIEEMKKYIIEPSGLKIYGNQDLSDKIIPDKSYNRKSFLIKSIREKKLKNLITFPYFFFWSPYFRYNFFSLFLK